jgi:parallel beta-helix repeat protein
MANAIHIEGSMLPNGWTNPEADTIMLTGTFSVTNSVFTNAETGAFGNYLTNANVAFCDNTFTAPIASPAAPAEDFAVMDVSSTSVLMCGNHGTATAGFALWAGQSVWKSGLLPSTVTITDNDFQVYEGANAVILQDFGTPSTLKAVVSGNVFQTPSRTGYFPTSGYSVIISQNLKSVVVSQNTILGGGSAGVYVSGGPGLVSGNTILGSYYGVFLDSANDVQVTGNVIKNSAQYGIAVTNGSSSNLIAHNIVMNSGVDDLYRDASSTGTGNVWIGNQYQTSNPLGLG